MTPTSLELLPRAILKRTTPFAEHHTALCWVAFSLHEANHLLSVDQWHEKTPGDGPSRIYRACHAMLHQLDGSADSTPTLAWAVSALPEVAQLSVAVVLVDVGEHLHDLRLFLFQTSDIQQKYSNFRDFQVRIHSENFLDEFQHQQLDKIVICQVPYIKKRHSLHGWKY